MAILETYRGMEVPDATPGEGGRAIKDNFKRAADWHPKSVWDATADPTATDDEGQDFHAGSLWLNTATNTLFRCLDSATGAAVWKTTLMEMAQDNSPQLGGDLDVQGHQITTSVTNGNLILSPNGNGALQADAGGDPRGSYAVDLQRGRSFDSMVSSGLRGFLGGGSDNTQSGDYGFLGAARESSQLHDFGFLGTGIFNTQSGEYGFLGSGHGNSQQGEWGVVVGGVVNTQSGYLGFIGTGSENTQSGHYGFLGAGVRNTQSGRYGVILSGRGAKQEHYGGRAHAVGTFAAQGDAQELLLVARNQTTNATAAEFFLNGSSERIVLPDQCTWHFEAMISARRADADGESAAYLLRGCIDRQTGAATTAVVGSVSKTVIAEDSAGWDVGAQADTTNGSLKLTVTGEAGKTIRWVTSIKIVQVMG